MKRSILNLILIIILVILPFIYLEILTAPLNNDIKASMNEPSVAIPSYGNEIEDVEGYGIIANSIVSGIGIGSALFVGFLEALLYVVAYGFGTVVIVLTVIATILSKKKVPYRILMSIVYFLYLVIELILLGVLCTTFSYAVLGFTIIIPI